MILKNLEKKENFTNSEKIAADFIINHYDDALHMTAKEIADAVFISTPTVTRLCKKLGFDNFSSFKVTLSKETSPSGMKNYSINSNVPFLETDDINQISEKISDLFVFSVTSAKSSLDYKLIESACNVLSKQEIIDIYGTGQALGCATNFCHKLNHIGYHTELISEAATQHDRAMNMYPGRASIVISYSGITPAMVRACKKLKAHGSKVILVSGNPHSEMLQYTDYPIIIDSEEKLSLNEKTDFFASTYILYYLFDVMFCTIFQKNYEKNLQRKHESATEQFNN